MLKQLLDDNHIFSALVCVLVFIAGGLLYLQSVKQEGRRAVQRTQKIVEQRSNPQTGEAESQSAPGGHYHPDGTYHVGSHEAHTPAGSTTNPQPRGATAQTAGTQPPLMAPAVAPQQARNPKTRYTPEQEAAVEAIQKKYFTQGAPYKIEHEQLGAKNDEIMEELAAYKQELIEYNAKSFHTPSDKARHKELGKLIREAVRLHDQNSDRASELRRKMADLQRKSLAEVRVYHRSIGLTFD